MDGECVRYGSHSPDAMLTGFAKADRCLDHRVRGKLPYYPTEA